MRIVHAIAGMGVGGAERMVLALTAAMAREHEVTVTAAPGALAHELAPDVRFVPLRESSRALASVAPAVAGLRRVLVATEPDLVHAHNPRITALVSIAMAGLGPRGRPRLLSTQHSEMAGADRRAARLLLHRVDRVVAVSETVARRLAEHGVAARRLAVVPNGIRIPSPPPAESVAALDAELGLAAGTSVVLAVGRLVPAKAFERLLAAAATLRTAVPGVRVVIAGDGPLRGELEAQAARLGLGGTVIFAGLRRDIPRLLARADVLVFSSEWEGLPIAALEGMALGTPVVSTDVGEMPALVRRGAGVVVPRDARALAAALSDLLGDPARRRAMGEAGRRTVAEEYDEGAMVRSYQEQYERLMGGP